MISSPIFYRRLGTNPTENIAAEAFLLETLKAGEFIFYLWQNKHTIVIGRNQNAWKECFVDEFEKTNGIITRRLSGGGAVYHDLGNLNFTFIANQEDYNLNKQLSVIENAVRSFGIQAERSGRNDILVQGKKFSGNAFYTHQGKSYHHGTIMINVAIDKLSAFLNVPKDKLISNSVNSVRSRVINLSELNPIITIDCFAEALTNSFFKEYGVARNLSEDIFKSPRFSELYKKFNSLEWRLGEQRPFSFYKETRFSWGSFDMQLEIVSGKIAKARIFSDSLNDSLFPKISQCLVGCEFNKDKIISQINKISSIIEISDIISFIKTINL